VYANPGVPFTFRFNANTFAPKVDTVFSDYDHTPYYTITENPANGWLFVDNATRTIFGVPPSNITQETIAVTIYAATATNTESADFSLVITPLQSISITHQFSNLSDNKPKPSNSTYTFTVAVGATFNCIFQWSLYSE
jgi:hypothetical protein